MTWEEVPLFDLPPSHRQRQLPVLQVSVMVPVEVSVPLDPDILLSYCHQSGEMFTIDDLTVPKNLRWAIENAALHAAHEEYGGSPDEIDCIHWEAGFTLEDAANEIAQPTYVRIEDQ